MIYAAIQQMAQGLTNLNAFLDAGAKLADTKSFDAENLLNARLAPDMFNLIRQVQSAADTAKFAAARLAGKDGPSDPDNETTVDALKARLDKTVAYLASFEATDFDGAEAREVKLSFLPLPASGQNYLLQFAQPNFYFHLTTAYAILRHNGADLGKRDFIGHMDLIGA
jgi:hypothetical protein